MVAKVGAGATVQGIPETLSASQRNYMKTRRETCLIVTRADFPEGRGRTQRLMTLARAIQNAGWRVEIWIEEPLTGKISVNWARQGVVDGIAFRQYSSSSQRRHQFQSVPRRLWTCARIAWDLSRRPDVGILIMNVPFLHDGVPITLSAWLAKIPWVFAFEDERVDARTSGSGLIRRLAARVWNLSQSLCDSWLAPRADGTIVISSYLRRKYEALGCRNLVLVPTLVDERDWRLGDPEDGVPELFYSGESTEDIYEFSNLLRAFELVRRKGLSFRVSLVVGRPDVFKSVAFIQREVEALGLSQHVELLDVMPLAALKERMRRARFLLCIRKDNRLARSGAATKLSEYLSTGRVVILTPVGDIVEHLQDRRNSIVAQDTTVEAIHAALLAALGLSPGEQAEIGSRGRDLAATLFSPVNATKVLDGFLGGMARAGKS